MGSSIKNSKDFNNFNSKVSKQSGVNKSMDAKMSNTFISDSQLLQSLEKRIQQMDEQDTD